MKHIMKMYYCIQPKAYYCSSHIYVSFTKSSPQHMGGIISLQIQGAKSREGRDYIC